MKEERRGNARGGKTVLRLRLERWELSDWHGDRTELDMGEGE